MADFDKIFEEIQHSDKAEKSLKEFSNWILGISTGICALLVFEIRDFYFESCAFLKLQYKIILIFSMANILLTGFNKYYILKRDVAMNIKYASLKKLLVFSEINKKKPEEIKEQWETKINEWATEHNKIKTIGRLLNITIFTTLATIVMIGVFILLII
jgi:hypothetical protein